MPSFAPPSSATEPSQAWVEALHSGTRALQLALQRLFATHTVAVEVIEQWPPTTAAEHGRSGDIGSLHQGAAFDVSGPLRARLTLLATEGDAEQLTAALRGVPSRVNRVLDAEDYEAYSEMANIAASSFLNGLARELQLRLLPSVPSLSPSTLGELVRALEASGAWVTGARFSVSLPSGTASALFIAAPEPGSIGA